MCSPNFSKELDQSAAVARLLHAHALKDRSGGRKVGAQTLHVVGINALVFLFEGNGKRQNFLFGKTVEIPHGFVLRTARKPPSILVNGGGIQAYQRFQKACSRMAAPDSRPPLLASWCA